MVRVNDKFDIQWQEGMTVEDLLAACNFTYPSVVVLVNGQPVPREAYGTFQIEDDADVKVLHMIAGG